MPATTNGRAMATTARRKKAEAFLETVGGDVSKAIRAGKSTDLPLMGGTFDAQSPSGSIFRGGGGGGDIPSSLPTRRVPQSPSPSSHPR